MTGVIYPDLTPQTPKVLMACKFLKSCLSLCFTKTVFGPTVYQAEVLDEEQAVTWGKHVR